MPGPIMTRRIAGNPYPNLAALFASAGSQRATIADGTQVGLNPGASDFAVAFWVYLNSSAATQAMVSKGAQSDTVAEAPGYRIFATTTPQLQIQFGDTGDGTRKSLLCTTTNLVVGQWGFVVVNFNRAGNLAPFINTVAQNTLAIGTENGTVTAAANFGLGYSGGNAADNPTLHLNGLLDSVGFWTKALSAAEIADLYRNGVGMAYRDLSGTVKASLVSWWNLDGNLMDSHAANHLTNVNGVSFSGGKR